MLPRDTQLDLGRASRKIMYWTASSPGFGRMRASMDGWLQNREKLSVNIATSTPFGTKVFI